MSGKYWNRAWSLVSGCTPCSPGCQNCWLEAIGKRFHKWPEKVTPRFDRLEIPLHIKKPTVWALWSDWCHKNITDSFRRSILNIARMCPQHIFLALTKRDKVLAAFNRWQEIHVSGFCWPDNWWNGLTICTQKEADEKIPIFLQMPGNKFLSIEPMIENIDLDQTCPGKPVDNGWCWRASIDWVIAGAETGPRARPCDLDWLRSIRDQCQAARVPFFLKQVDKKRNCLLDGKEHNEKPF